MRTLTDSQTKTSNANIVNDKYKILVVDDDPVMLRLIQKYYPSQECEIDYVTTGKDALSKINQYYYDLVLLDIMLPDINGYEVCKKIRENFVLYELPIIVITARSSISDVVESFKSGANDYISKPFEQNELLARTKTQIKLKRLINANEHLQQAINHKNKFIQMAIHDLRNPLTTILGTINLMKMGGIINKEFYEYASLIQDSADLMMNLINDLIHSTKFESSSLYLRKELVDMNQTTIEVIKNNKNHAVQKSQKIVFSPGNENQSYIISDRIRIKEIIDNLLSNAIKYSPHNSNIWIYINNVNNNGTNLVEFVIKDEGPGFSKGDKQILFSKFRKLSANPTGGESSIGLGLSIVKQLVDMLDGTIILESETGGGSKFIIQFKQYY